MDTQDTMIPMDGEAAVLIPGNNMRSDIPGTYGWLKKHYHKAKNSKKIKTTDGGYMTW